MFPTTFDPLRSSLVVSDSFGLVPGHAIQHQVQAVSKPSWAVSFTLHCMHASFRTITVCFLLSKVYAGGSIKMLTESIYIISLDIFKLVNIL